MHGAATSSGVRHAPLITLSRLGCGLTRPALPGTVPRIMRYDEFVGAWRRHFENSRLFSTLGTTNEMLDLGSMSRHRDMRLMGAGLKQVEPYTISVKLEWRWDALHTARTTTTRALARNDPPLLGRNEPGWFQVTCSTGVIEAGDPGRAEGDGEETDPRGPARPVGAVMRARRAAAERAGGARAVSPGDHGERARRCGRCGSGGGGG